MRNFIFFMIMFMASSAVLRAGEITSLDERLTDLELKNLAQSINLGLEVKTMGGYSRISHNSSDQYGTGGVAQYAGLIRLNLNGKVNDRLKFYSSLQSMRYFNEDVLDASDNHSVLAQVSSGESVRLFKAYFDYDFNDIFTLSVGRLPTTQGPPVHLKEGKERTGTYPLVAYSVPFDGAAFTMNLHRYFKLPFNFYSRTIFKPSTISDNTFYYVKPASGNPSNPNQRSKNSQLYTQMIEFEHEDAAMNWWKKALLIFQVSYFKFGGMAPRDNQVSTTNLVDTRVYGDSQNSFNLSLLTGYLELQKIKRSEFDAYFSYTWSRINNPATLKAVALTGPTSSSQALGPFIAPNGSNGRKILVGMRHEFTPTQFWGSEFIYGSKYAAPTAFYMDNIFNPYLDNGKTYQFYYLKKLFSGAAFLQVTYQNMLQSSTIESGISFVETSRRVETLYTIFGFQI